MEPSPKDGARRLDPSRPATQPIAIGQGRAPVPPSPLSASLPRSYSLGGGRPAKSPSTLGPSNLSSSLTARSPPTRDPHLQPRRQTSLVTDPSVERSPDEGEHRRRAVSDAAQWVRKRRQSELMRELLPATASGASKHKFVEAAHGSSVFCGVCSKLIWGFHRSNLRCGECGFTAHKVCQSFAPSCLGRQGSVAHPDASALQPPGSPTALSNVKLVRICISSADGLVRRNLLRHPDPFCVVSVDGEQYQTAVARKTLSPQWQTTRDIYLASSSKFRVFVFDAKKFRRGEWVGFLGMALIPASAIVDSSSLGDDATKVFTFRLRKRVPSDVVTGTICVKAAVLSDAKPPTRAVSSPISLRRKPDASGRTPESSSLGRSPLPDSLPRSPFKSLLPPTPDAPTATLAEDGTTIKVSWSGDEVGGEPPAGITYSLAVVTDKDHRVQDIYKGPLREHNAVGVRPGQEVRFVVQMANFYGTSEYSAPSEAVCVPVTEEKGDGEGEGEGEEVASAGTASEAASAGAGRDARPHCPMLMAGFCFRGSSCPFSHGDGMQTADDVAAALIAAAYFADPDVQMAAALEASLVDLNKAQFDDSEMPQYKRDYHVKEQKLRQTVCPQRGECSFFVQRGDLFKTSFLEVHRRTPEELRRRLCVQFAGEGGLDYGGLAREWFYLLSEEIFAPALGMFCYCRSDDYALQINPNSATDEDHLWYFNFVGRVMGMAVLHRHFLDVSFTVAFYKQLLGLPLSLSDLQDVDPDVHQSMLWILENDISGVPGMSFTADYEHFGEVVTHELKPGGEDIDVEEANKEEFVRLMTEWRLLRGTSLQMETLIQGFYEIIPQKEIAGFDERELAFLLSGTMEYDLEDWKRHTVYKGYNQDSQSVQWLWEIVASFGSDHQATFLQFCTGSSRLPLEGFQGLQGSDGPRKFCVQRVEDVERLPSAHTCFNRLDLPPFPSLEVMRERLMLAMQGSQGFTGD